MANKNAVPPKDKQFKKGQVANPKGRPINPFAAYRKMTVEIYREVIELIFDGDIDGLQNIVQDKKEKVLKVALAACVLKAMKSGDYSVIEQMMSRVVGKIPDEINVNSKNLNTNLNTQLDMTKLKAAMKKLESDV